MDPIDWERCGNVPIGDGDIFNARKMIVRALCSRLPQGRFSYVYVNPDEEPTECAECVCIPLATNHSEEKRSCAYNEELLKTFRDVICGPGADGTGPRATLEVAV